MKWVLSVLVALVMCSCSPGLRQSAASVMQAQQASQAAAILASSSEVGDALGHISEEDRQVIESALRKIIDLSSVAANALQPVIDRLTVDEPAAPIRTSVDQAVHDTQAFVVEVERQVGRTEQEAQQAETAARFRAALAEYADGFLGSSWAMSLTGGGSGILAILTGLALRNASRGKRIISTLRTAIDDAVQCGHELAGAKTPDEVKEVKRTHEQQQKRHGTHDIIDPLVQRLKPRRMTSTATLA